VSSKLDVYAFGVVLFEIISGKPAILPAETTTSPQPLESRTLVHLVDYCFQTYSCIYLLIPTALFAQKLGPLRCTLWPLIYFLLPNYWYKNLPTIMLRLCFCLALQFSQVLEDPSGPAYLHKYVDPALNGDYPVDSMWKVRSCGTSNSNLSHGLMSVSRVRFT
jgi:hypothetical protein